MSISKVIIARSKIFLISGVQAENDSCFVGDLKPVIDAVADHPDDIVPVAQKESLPPVSLGDVAVHEEACDFDLGISTERDERIPGQPCADVWI